MNQLRSDPVSDATPTVIIVGFPAPAGSWHTIAVVDIQLVVLHSVAPIHAVGDVSAGPRFMPDIVSAEPPVVGPFTGAPPVSTGAAPCARPMPRLAAAAHRLPLGSTNHYHTSTSAHTPKASHAPSYVNELRSVLVSDATSAVIIAGFPAPAGSLHTIAVVDIQLVVLHCVASIHAVGDVSAGPKLMPHSVEPPVVGPLTGLSIVSTGAARRDQPVT